MAKVTLDGHEVNTLVLTPASGSAVTKSLVATNTYAAGDAGKVVKLNGSTYELAAQTARSSNITANGTYDTTENNSVTVAVSGGGGGGSSASGTFTPSEDLRSITLSDCIGKQNCLIYPISDLPTQVGAIRTHWGGLAYAGNSILYGGTNTSSGAYVMSAEKYPSTPEWVNKNHWDASTGTYTIKLGADANGGGYFPSGFTYGYIAW